MIFRSDDFKIIAENICAVEFKLLSKNMRSDGQGMRRKDPRIQHKEKQTTHLHKFVIIVNKLVQFW